MPSWPKSRWADEFAGGPPSQDHHPQEKPMTTTTAQPETRILEVPGATLAYDVRLNQTTTEPPLFLIGSPMAAPGFGSLAARFGDRTIITYDPRGSERSTKADPASPSTPEEHADDLHRVIEALGLGPVDLFASSGGAVNALALVAAHPEDVRTLVAHEPPAAGVLPDRDAAQAASRAVHHTYVRSGFGAGMAHFIALVSHEGLFPDDWASQPAPDPAMFGMPTEDDGSRDDPLLGQNIVRGTHWEPDIDALRAAGTRVVIAVGEESREILTGRAGFIIAERLGSEPVIFPGGHGGFLGGEYGQMGVPDAFATRLREVLAQR
jgi:pimeloyl-ACP methyl ester carboxylesterase